MNFENNVNATCSKKEKYSSQEFVKGVKRGLVTGEIILRQLLRKKDEFEKK